MPTIVTWQIKEIIMCIIRTEVKLLIFIRRDYVYYKNLNYIIIKVDFNLIYLYFFIYVDCSLV